MVESSFNICRVFSLCLCVSRLELDLDLHFLWFIFLAVFGLILILLIFYAHDINTSKVVKVIFKNLYLNISWEKLGMKLERIVKYYKLFIFSKFQKKKNVFWKLWTFENFVLNLNFWSYFSFLDIFGSIVLGLYR